MSRQETILVVDDSPQNIQTITALLKENYRVKAATNGERALTLASGADQPDLILLDIVMPGMDGYEVCKRLKSNPGTAHIPIIFLTGKTDAVFEVQAFQHGAVDYIHKPFDPTIVRTRIAMQMALRDALYRAEQAENQAHQLLDTLLPVSIAEEVRLSGTVIPKRYDQVAVLFCDIVNFTPYCDAHEPEEVISQLDALFLRLEVVASQHGLEKIKTIGDAFMAAANLLRPLQDPTVRSVRCGLEMIASIREMGLGWNARVGVHVGPVVAGVVGQERYQYDIWGNTVNVAARMAGMGDPDTMTVTEETWLEVAAHVVGASRGVHPVKGKGLTHVYQIEKIRARASPMLTYSSGGQPQEWLLETNQPQPVTIGRDAGCQICINDQAASRKHARLVYLDDQWFVEDLRSANGTFVNQSRITKQILNHHDVLRIGDQDFRFVNETQSEKKEDTGDTVRIKSPSRTSLPKPQTTERVMSPAAPAVSSSASVVDTARIKLSSLPAALPAVPPSASATATPTMTSENWVAAAEFPTDSPRKIRQIMDNKVLPARDKDKDIVAPMIKTFVKGETIFREGSTSHLAYFIKSGQVELSMVRDGQKIVLERAELGRCFGEMASILGDPRSATAVASEYTEAYLVDKQALGKLLQQANPLLRTIIITAVERIKKMNETVASLATASSVLIAFSAILELLARSLGEGGGRPRGSGTPSSSNNRLTYKQCIDTLITCSTLPLFRVKLLFRRMADLNLVTIDGAGEQATVRFDPAKVVGDAQNLTRNMGPMIQEGLQKTDTELIELNEVKSWLGVEEKSVFQKLAAEDVPPDLLLFRRTELEKLLQDRGSAYFSEPTSKTIDEISGLGDVRFVDKETLAQVLGNLEPYDLALLLKKQEPAVNEYILSVFSERMRGIISDTMKSIVQVDKNRVSLLEDQVIACIKQASEPSLSNCLVI